MTRHWRRLSAVLLIVVLPTVARGQDPDLTTGPDDVKVRADRELRELRIEKPTAGLFSINGALLGTLQWLAKSDVAQGSVFGASSLDVTVTMRPADWVRVFLDLEGLVGRGPDQTVGTLSRLNNNADHLEGKDKALLLRKLVLRLGWFEERVRFSIGKLDVGDYFDRNFFAEDETTQFLDSALLSSPLLKPPPNGPGAAVRISVGDWRYAFGVNAPDDVDKDMSGLPYVIGELGHRNIFALRGHYRLWARVSSVFDKRDRVTWGAGINVDQLVTPEIGVFFRAGVSRSQGESLTSHAWSAGVQLTPTRLGRGKDALGIGYSDQREPDGRERMAETYYRLALRDNFFLITNVQWVLSGPNLVKGGTNRNLVVPGLRALFLF